MNIVMQAPTHLSNSDSNPLPQGPTRLAADSSIILCAVTVLINCAVAIWDPISPLMAPQLRATIPVLPQWGMSILFNSAWFLAYALPVVLSYYVREYCRELRMSGFDLGATPARIVSSFYIPFLNLVEPGEIMPKVFAAAGLRPTALLRFWQVAWSTVVLTIVTYFFSTILVYYIPGVNPHSGTAVGGALWIPVQTGFALFLGTTMKLIHVLQQRQDERTGLALADKLSRIASEEAKGTMCTECAKKAVSTPAKIDMVLITLLAIIGITELTIILTASN